MSSKLAAKLIILYETEQLFQKKVTIYQYFSTFLILFLT